MKFDNERLRDMRKAKGMTQDQLADALSVSRVSVTQWEKGKHTPPLEMIGRIGELLGVAGSFFIQEG